MERGVSAMKKILLIMMTVTTALVMTACSGKTNSQTSSEDYKYSSYVYDDNAPQYYMSDNSGFGSNFHQSYPKRHDTDHGNTK